MNYRCNSPNDRRYKRYGGRGIKVELTKEELLFLWNRDRAHLLDIPSIDRIDPDKNYCLENCRFIEKKLNTRRRGFKMEKDNIKYINFAVDREFHQKLRRYCFDNEKTMKEVVVELVNKFLDKKK